MDNNKFDKNIIDWLLESNDISMRYRTLTELLDFPQNDNNIISLQKQISNSKPVLDILNKMRKFIGDDVEYGAFATTHFCLSYLSELGLTKENPAIAKAAERYLNLQKNDGDWWNHLSCLTGYNLRTFTRLGYKNDKRIKKTIELLLSTNRIDNGYLCDLHEKRKKKSKSCIRGAVKVLLAFADLPEYWDHPRIKALVDYFLVRDGIYRNDDKNTFVNKDISRLSFPIIWRVNIFEILYSLSRMGYGKDRRLKNAWRFFDTLKSANGKYKLDWTPIQCPWKVGKRGIENKWITFYSLLAQKYK